MISLVALDFVHWMVAVRTLISPLSVVLLALAATLIKSETVKWKRVIEAGLIKLD